MEKRLYRSRTEKMLGGVCGGLGEYLGLDPTLVRVVWVLVTLLGAGALALVYVVLWVLIPLEPPAGVVEPA